MSVYQWSTTAGSNASADSNINWSEGQLPSTVNDSARAMMAALAALVRDQGGYATLGGSGNTFTLSLSQAMTSRVPSLIGFFATRSNTGAVTMNVDSLGAAPLRSVTGTDLVSGDIVNGAFYIISWDSTNSEWKIANRAGLLPLTGGTMTGNLTLAGAPTSNLQAATKSYVDEVTPAGSIMAFAASSAPTGWLICDGSAISRATYATLFAVVGTTWGVGDGSTTFNIPDFRGQFLRGFDSRATSTSNDTTRISGITTSGNTTVSGINNTTYLYAGMPISGTGISAGTTISSVSANSIVLSANATASSPTLGSGATTNTSRTVTVSSTSTLSVGQAISGTGIPVGAYITNIFNSTTIIISAAATATNTGLTFTFGTAITVGRTFGSAQGDAYANHDHGIYDPSHQHTDNTLGGSGSLAGGGSFAGPTTTSTGLATTGIIVNNSYTGNTETRPKNYAVLYIIKT